MTFGELTSEVFRRLEESEASPAYWSRADVQAALNEGYAEISDAAEWHETRLTLDLLKDRPYYDLRTCTGDTVLSVRSAYNAQTHRWLIPSRVTDLDRTDLRWEGRAGEPERVIQRGLWWVGLWPRTASESGTVDLRITTLPVPLSEDVDEPGFPATLHQGLVEYALADLWAQDGETTKALQAWQQYLAYERALTGWLDGRVGVPLVQGGTA